MARNRYVANQSFILGMLDDFVPQDHFVRKLDNSLTGTLFMKSVIHFILKKERIELILLFYLR